MADTNLLSSHQHKSAFSRRSRLRGRASSRRPLVARRTARFEPLESRQMLAVDLGFAGAFSLINAPANSVYAESAPYYNVGGGTVTDAAGNRYVTVNGAYSGNISSQTVDLDPGPGVLATTIDAAVVKLDPNNNVLWTAPLKPSVNNAPIRVLIAVDANQNVYMAGDFRGAFDVDPGPGVVTLTSTAAGTDYGYYLAKLNSAGQLQWARTLAANELTPYQVAVDSSGNLLVANNFTATISDPPLDIDAGAGQTFVQQVSSSSNSMVVLKYGTNGDFAWARQLGGTTASTTTLGIAASPQDDVYVTGRFTGSVDLDPGAGVHIVANNGTAKDAFLVRLDSSGNFVWADATAGTDMVSIRGIEFPSDGSILVSGGVTGTVNFQTDLGSVPITSDLSAGDAWVLKINSNSSVAWVKQFGGYTVLDSALDPAGNIYLGGWFAVNNPPAGQTYDFDPGPGVYNLVTPSTYATAYVASLTSTGDFRWAVPLGGNSGLSQVQGISVSPTGDVQVSGVFRGTGDFDPNPVTENLLTSSNGNQTVFTASLKQTTPDPGAPVVDAGQNATILVTAAVQLHGTVTDDGLPAPVTTTWSVVSGPGNVAFSDTSALDTSATFSTSGSYWLQLSATDTQFTSVDYVHVNVNPLSATLVATADTYLDGGKTTTNYGTSATLTINGKPDDGALLKWNLSSIPIGSTLQSASISINVTGTSANTYEIYELKRNWTESQATWKQAATGSNWQTAGAQGSSDRGTTVLGTITATSTGLWNIALNAAGVSVVQGWINNPASNFGFIIQDYADANRDDLLFNSKEVSIAANRPQLQLIYNPPTPSGQSLLLGSLKAQATKIGVTSAAPSAPVTSVTFSPSPPVKVSRDGFLNLLATFPARRGGKMLVPAESADNNDERSDQCHAAALDQVLSELGGQLGTAFKLTS